MSLRSTPTRPLARDLARHLVRGLALAAATGALAGTVTVAPATAGDLRRDGGPGVDRQDRNARDGGGQDGGGRAEGAGDPGGRDEGFDGRGDRDPRRYRGVVTAKGGMWLHDRPDRGGRRVRVAREGETVSIYCKTRGVAVDGNSLWYLLTDGTWAWGSARYIDNVGPAPRWC
ncbi:SH3 domain-containing protein [Streptomyces sp. TG1A-8]|nr:SH3 domain-containing protein [Streptomyces sp. TG1A-8]MDO0925734.1 SH3 domain-containing protein [Streptomyces sp. TG1A-8]